MGHQEGLHQEGLFQDPGINIKRMCCFEERGHSGRKPGQLEENRKKANVAESKKKGSVEEDKVREVMSEVR